jgi:hypothetical protein
MQRDTDNKLAIALSAILAAATPVLNGCTETKANDQIDPLVEEISRHVTRCVGENGGTASEDESFDVTAVSDDGYTNALVREEDGRLLLNVNKNTESPGAAIAFDAGGTSWMVSTREDLGKVLGKKEASSIMRYFQGCE